MSATNTLTLQAAGDPCPTWCAREAHAEAAGSHVSSPVQLNAPDGTNPETEVPMLSVQIGVGHDEESRGERPRLWLSTIDGATELDTVMLGSLVSGLEQFALQLRGLGHRYDEVILGGKAEAVELHEGATHPLELVTPCPPWCQYRDLAEHTPTGLLTDHFHSSGETAMELEHRSASKVDGRPLTETVELGMEHLPYAPLPQVCLTVGRGGEWLYVPLTLDEADQLRSSLTEFVAQGREYSRPEDAASPQEVIDYCGARIIENAFHVKGFSGHAVGETRHGGPVWVTVPKGTTGPCLEQLVMHLLAEVHESVGELTTWFGAGGEVTLQERASMEAAG